MHRFRLLSSLTAFALSLAIALTSIAATPLHASDLSAAALVADEGGLAAAINQQRLADGLSALTVDQDLTAIARIRSLDQIDRKYFSHVTPDGTTVVDILNSNNIPWRVVGENLAELHGLDPVRTSIDGFMASPEHRDNILDPTFKRVGVGAAAAGDGTMILTVVFTG